MNEILSQEDHWQAGLSNNQSKALSLLGQGVSPVMVASTLGVSEALISQFLSDGRFASEVTKLKLHSLQQQTALDNKYVEAEVKLVDKLLKVIPLMTKPMDILRGIQTVNATKRRGAQEGSAITQTSNIVQITLPGVFAAKFVTNSQNQVVEVQDDTGARSLITATPASLDQFAAEAFRESEAITGTCWEGSTSSEHIMEQASARLAEQGVPETIPKGLRRGLETKGQITANDL